MPFGKVLRSPFPKIIILNRAVCKSCPGSTPRDKTGQEICETDIELVSKDAKYAVNMDRCNKNCIHVNYEAQGSPTCGTCKWLETSAVSLDFLSSLLKKQFLFQPIRIPPFMSCFVAIKSDSNAKRPSAVPLKCSFCFLRSSHKTEEFRGRTILVRNAFCNFLSSEQQWPHFGANLHPGKKRKLNLQAFVLLLPDLLPHQKKLKKIESRADHAEKQTVSQWQNWLWTQITFYLCLWVINIKTIACSSFASRAAGCSVHGHFFVIHFSLLCLGILPIRLASFWTYFVSYTAVVGHCLTLLCN